jgi:hypothetical protein
LSPTASAVLQLAKTLPYSTYEFSLFCDNLFSNVELFSQLRALNIGACGTARPYVTNPVFGSMEKWTAEWGTLLSKTQAGINGNENVLVSIWQDSNIVRLCSTIHDGTEWTVRNRRKPKKTSTQANITKKPFQMFNPPSGCKDPYEQRRLLPIPGMIDDYNHHMGAVDIADQLRAKFTTAQRTKRSWLPLFY